MMDGDLLASVIRALGSIAGAVLALVFQPPKTRSEAIRRSIVAPIAGFIAAEPLRVQFGWADNWQMWFSSSAFAAALSWFVMGAVIRIIAKWSPPK